MTGREAEQTLSVIRTLMERSTTYTNLSGHAGIAAGALALAGSVVRLQWNTPFLPTWLGVLAAALAVTVLFTARMAQRSGEPLWTRQSRTVCLSLMPALAATLVLTALLARIGHAELLPGVWMLMWGVGALAMSFFTPRVISVLGLTFMAAGVGTFCAGPLPDPLCMGATFGLIHLGYGIALTLTPQPVYVPGAGADL